MLNRKMMRSRKITVIIAAGGTGTRFGGKVPKQFALLNKRPILWHALIAFSRFSPGIKIIVAMPCNSIPFWKEMIAQYPFTPGHILAEGGKTRFHSVKNALALCPDDGIILVHDAVRPFVSYDLIERIVKATAGKGAAIPIVEISDSIRQIMPKGSKVVNRKDFVRVQTPQGFNANLLKKAYMQLYSEKFTDDASVVESDGGIVTLVQGEEANIKITVRSDL